MSYKFNPFTGNLDVTPFSLDGAGKIPSNYLPSYVDDVVEYDDLAGFPGTGETGKIYVAKDTGYTYRWTGSVYVRIGSGGEVGLNLGSEGSPSLFFNGDANTGLYSPGADQVAISTSGTERIRITSDGKLGLGTSSPSYLLDVRRSSAGDVVAFTGSTDGGRPLKFASADNGIFLGAQWTRDIASGGGIHAWAINGSERARIDGSGRLLVGTSSARLHGSGTIPTLQVEGSSGALSIRRNIAVATALPANFFIGRARGGAFEAVTSGDYLGKITFTGADGSAQIAAATIEAIVDGTPGANDMPGRLVFSTTADGASSPTERMRIDSSGRIGINGEYNLGASNTISIDPNEGTIGFGMDGREEYITGTSGCYIYSGSGSAGTTLAGQLILQARSNTDRPITFVTGSTPAKRMEIAGNGNVTVVGALSKGSGSFKIDHPLPEKKETHHLVHSFIEGPQADLIYRGHVQLVNGVAAVNLDEAARMTEGTFEALCTNVCCFTSNESDWTAVRGSVSGNILRIEVQDPASNADVCWMVIGERKDQHMLDTNWTDENGRAITEPLKQQPVAEAS